MPELDRTHEELLKATLLDGDKAVASWRAWSGRVDIGALRGSPLALLPLLYQNLLRNGVSDSELAGLKDWYKRTWYLNQVALKQAATHLAVLHEAGIETLLLKGAAMTLVYYGDPGVRPMGDVDVLVKSDRAREAVELLAGSGLAVETDPTDDVLRYMHSTHCSDGDRFTIDLHWRLLWELGPADPHDSFWAGASTAQLQGVLTKVLDPADQLFHTCVNGARKHADQLRWVADAVTLLRKHRERIDFDRFLAAAERHRVVRPVRHALDYLQSAWPGSVPNDVRASLSAMRVSSLERASRRRRLGRYLRITDGDTVLSRLAELPRFLAFAWGLDSAWRVPAEILVRAARNWQVGKPGVWIG